MLYLDLTFAKRKTQKRNLAIVSSVIAFLLLNFGSNYISVSKATLMANTTTVIPSQRKKARIVYEEIAKAFEFDRDYSEREVNIIIADYHDDFCTIRRDMIAENLLERDNMIYRRK